MFGGPVWLFAVDSCRIKNALTLNCHAQIPGVDFSKEAGPEAFVACGSTDLMYFEEECICVTVKIDGLQFLDVSAFFALSPEFFSAAAVVADASSAKCFLPCVLIHPCHHEHLAGFGVLSDGWDQIV